MSRRKRRSPRPSRPAPAELEPRHPHPPRPPRPNKWLLLACAGLLAVWMAFLVAMAVGG